MGSRMISLCSASRLVSMSNVYVVCWSWCMFVSFSLASFKIWSCSASRTGRSDVRRLWSGAAMCRTSRMSDERVLATTWLDCIDWLLGWLIPFSQHYENWEADSILILDYNIINSLPSPREIQPKFSSRPASGLRRPHAGSGRSATTTPSSHACLHPRYSIFVSHELSHFAFCWNDEWMNDLQ